MTGHSLRHAVNIDADHAKVRDALTSLEGLKGWARADVSGGGGVSSWWSLNYPGGPSFVWQVSAHDDHKVEWRCVEGPGDSAGATATFEVVKIMTEEPLTKDMEAFTGAEPRTGHDVLKQYHGQPYPVLYRAFGNLRHKLGRTNDPPWYRYTLSDKPFAWQAKPQALNHSDPRHMKTAG